jgi:hypothetical protein
MQGRAVSAIYTTSDTQARVAAGTIAEVDASGLWPGPVVTELAPAGPFLGGRTGAPGPSGAPFGRLHLSLRSARVEAATLDAIQVRLTS